MRLLLGAALLLSLVAVGTYWAGERVEVAVLRTSDTEGRTFETKMWVVDHGGVPWVRVANPERGWYRRLLAEPRVELVRGDVIRPCLARPHDTPEVASAVDAAFRAKYGVVDWWYGLLLRRHAIPIELAPVTN